MNDQLKQWVKISVAAEFIGRPERTVYSWVSDNRLRSRKGEEGVTLVRYADVLEVESTIKRGRPPGTPDRAPRRSRDTP